MIIGDKHIVVYSVALSIIGKKEQANLVFKLQNQCTVYYNIIQKGSKKGCWMLKGGKITW